MIIEFTVPGIAKTAGSHQTYKGRIRHANPKTVTWMNDVKWWARKYYPEDKPLLLGPIRIIIEFCFMRPSNHFGTGKNAKILKSSAPQYHIKTPDLDKLVRAIQDALTGVIYKDDKQIYAIAATKEYGEKPKAIIKIQGE